jgi:hypothetical protein
VRKADNLTTSCAVVMKSGNFNFLEPSGSLQACNGTALHLPYHFVVKLLETNNAVSCLCSDATNSFVRADSFEYGVRYTETCSSSVL